jgi:hypothetical protein
MAYLSTLTGILFWIICMIFPSSVLAGGFEGTVPNVGVDWTQPKHIELPQNENMLVLNHHYAYHEPLHGYLPSIRIRIDNVLVDSVAVTFHDTTGFSAEELGVLSNVDWPNIKLYNIRTYTEFKDIVSEIDIVPIDTTGGFSKPFSITLQYFYDKIPLNKISYNFYKNNSKNSVLAEGTWIKIGVLSDGIHKITSDFLKNNGVNINQIDPRKIRLFGNGGKLLPQPNNIPVPDLIENAIYVVGEEDGRFDASDYILFYGQGPHLLEHDTGDGKIVYQHHHYSDTGFYFLNFDIQNGKRVQLAENLAGNYPEITYFDDLKVHKNNLRHILTTFPNNIGGSGRNWYGEDFGIGKKEVKVAFDLKGIRQNADVMVVSSLAASSRVAPEFTLRIGNQVFGKQNLGAIIEGEYFDKATFSTEVFTSPLNQAPSDGILTISLTYDNPLDTRTIGFLDYVAVKSQRELALYAPQTSFSTLSSTNQSISKFVIKNANGSARVWDITDGLNPKAQNIKLEGSVASFSTSTDQLKKFVVFDGAANIPSPLFAGNVPNQNLHGQETPNLLIVTHRDFLMEAERLASFRRSHDGYSVLVATTDQVYNEFSSGAQDVTAIRNYVKYLYDKGGRDGLQHLLLFGKPSFDFKNIMGKNMHFVPTYQSRNSSHPIQSYASDDYFGFLGNEEGEWAENFIGDHLLKIGVGRLPVASVEDARVIVDKLIHYSSSPATFGDWRKQIYFVADDEDNNIHLNDAERLVNQIEAAYPRYDLNKIYLDAYPQVGKPNEKSPETTRAINEMIEKGAFMVNFIGHGSPYQWTQEQILTIATINEWKNFDKLPLFVTATCQFGRQDNPTSISGAEYMLFSPYGGAIGLVTTGRPVYASSNYNLNRAFYQAVFERNGQRMPTLGEIFRHTKNNSLQGSNNRSFSLLADPSMTLAYPKKDIVINSVTSFPGNVNSDTVKALQKVRIQGEIQSGGMTAGDFQGVVYASIFDRKSTTTTFGDKGQPTTFKQWDNLIFNGGGSVNDGMFSIEFVAPKNIASQIGDGKISLYAFDAIDKVDAGGAVTSIKVGGSITGAPYDNSPPQVRLYMNDTLFRDGGLSNSSPVLLARLFDESGINISNRGIGQEMTISLNDGPPVNVSHFYRSDTDDYRKGWLRYPLSGLDEGAYEITFKVWDTHNNSTEASIQFVVGDKRKLEIRRLIPNPNPFRDVTGLSFEHNRPTDDLAVWAKLYSVRGELIRSFEKEVKNSNSVVYLFNWNGSGASGKKLETGVYIFKVFVRSLKDGSESNMSTKITLIN